MMMMMLIMMMISHGDDANNVESCNCEKFAKCLNAGTAACIGRQVSSKLELGNLGRAHPIPSTGQCPVPTAQYINSKLELGVGKSPPTPSNGQ